MTEVPDLHHLARRIQELRQAKSMSQEEFARQAGCSRSTISALERGKTEHISNETVGKILRFLERFRGYEDTQTVTFPGNLRRYAKRGELSFSEAERLLLSHLRPPQDRTEEEWELLHRLLREYGELFEMTEQPQERDSEHIDAVG
jgi:transcriptional regulator with XRE-family HTH domain